MIIDREKLEALLARYAIAGSASARGELTFCCRRHDDSKPSASINVNTGLWRCNACQASGNITTLIMDLEHCDTTTATRIIEDAHVAAAEAPDKKAGRKRLSKSRLTAAWPMAQVDLWHNALMSDLETKARLQGSTGWTDDSIVHFKIGYCKEKEAYTIPAIDDNVCVRLKFYYPGKAGQKYVGTTGHNQLGWFNTAAFAQSGPLWIMEGEKDCILATQYGLRAVSPSGGAQTKPEGLILQVPHNHSDVYICYDIDPAGREGSSQMAIAMAKAGFAVREVELPTEGMPANGDFSDYAKNQAIVNRLVETAAQIKPIQLVFHDTKVEVPDEVVPTFLEDIIKGKHFFRRVRMRVRVVSVGTSSTYLVPDSARVACRLKDRNFPQCKSCFGAGGEFGLLFTYGPSSGALMRLIDSDDNQLRSTILSEACVPPRCNLVDLEYGKFQSLYPIVLIPALEHDKLRHSYVMQTAWALDITVDANEDYLAEAVVMTDFRNQELSIICYKMEKDVSSVDQFELTPEMAENLKVFQCQ